MWMDIRILASIKTWKNTLKGSIETLTVIESMFEV